MTHYHIGADKCNGQEMSSMKTIAKQLEKCGHKVTIGSVSPEQEAASYHVSKKSVFLFLTCGVAPATIWSFKIAIAKGASPPTIFLHASWENGDPSSPMRSEKKMLNYPFIPEWDSGGFANKGAMNRDRGSAKTVGAYAKKYSKYVGVAWAKNPKEMGEKICNGEVTGFGQGSGGGGSGKSGSSGSNNKSGSYSSNGQSSTGSSGSSPLLNGEQTFEDLIGDICKGIDVTFAVKRSTVVVSDYESIFAEAKYLRDIKNQAIRSEDIQMWQVEDGTYELDVNQYGFYNTVKVHYKNGVVTESYEDLVRVYGVIAIDYYETSLDKTTAIMKAKAYLAAHVRDFDMAVKATILDDGDIEIGDIITIDNPLTVRDDIRKNKEKRDPEYYFVKGKSVSWEGDSPITADLDLRYGAESPEGKEIPEAGTTYSNDKSKKLKSQGLSAASGDIKSAIDEIGKKYSSIKYSGACQTADCVKKQKTGDCFGMSDLLYCSLKQLGVTAKIVTYPSPYSGSGTHRSVLYKDENGKWKDFPYRKYGFNSNFNDMAASKTGKRIKGTCD